MLIARYTRYVRSSLAASLTLCITTLAAARQPPSLVSFQSKQDAARCTGLAVSGAGYRDSVARFGASDTKTRRHGARATGYRDMLIRFPAIGSAHQRCDRLLPAA
ncbi:MAG TPA: hypothetical protein VIM73_20095 [Polyangiaceae bacterium]